MREIAILALAQEHKLGTLVQHLSSRVEGTRDKSNVRRFFEAKNPRPEIVESLIQIVGMTAKHRRAAETCLTPREQDEAIESALHDLDRETAYFQGPVLKDIKRTVRDLSKEGRARAAAAYVLGQFHSRADIEDPRLLEQHFPVVSRLGEPLAAFLLTLGPDFDLERSIATGARPVGHLFHLYSMMRNWGLTQEESDTVVSVAASFLRNHGVTPTELAVEHQYLERNRTIADKGCRALHEPGNPDNGSFEERNDET